MGILTFRIIDWHVEEIKDVEMVVHLSGLTIDNKQVYCKVLGFKPHCYLELPLSVKWTNSKAQMLFEFVQKKLKECPPETYKLETRMLNMYSLKRRFLRIDFNTKSTYRHLSNTLRWKWNVPDLGEFEPGTFKLHEQNINDEIKMGVQANIDMAGWVDVKPLKLDTEEYPKNFSYCDHSVYVHIKNVKRSTKYTNDDQVDPLICAADSELHSINRKSKSPTPEVEGNVMTIYTLAFGRLSQPLEEWDVHTISLFDCEAKQGVVHDCQGNEKKFIKMKAKLIKKYKPDVFTGYNINGFDWGAWLTRAKINGLIDSTKAYTEIPECLHMGKLRNGGDFVKDIGWASSARGKQEKKYVKIMGVLNFDLFNEISFNYKLPTYSLGHVSTKFLGGETKDDMPYQQMFILYDMISSVMRPHLDGIQLDYDTARKLMLTHISNKEMLRIPNQVNHPADMVDEINNTQKYSKLMKISQKYWKLMVDYCIQDTILVPKLMAKLNSLISLWENANICKVPASFIYDRGQQVKVTAQIIEETYRKGYVFSYVDRNEEVEDDDDDSDDDSDDKAKKKKKAKYQGGAVMKSQPGVHERVAILDFASLYPSIMRSKNMCYTTYRLNNDTRVTDDECYIAQWSEHKGCKHDTSGTKRDNILCGDNKYRFVKPVEGKPETHGILPRILTNLLNYRASVKKDLKVANTKYKEIMLIAQNQELSKEQKYEMLKEKVNASILDSRQLAIKVSANSIYGYTGVKAGMQPCEAIAASVTYYSRMFIKESERLVCEKWPNAEVIYGDSVSGDTPLLLRDNNGVIHIKTIETLSNEWESYDVFKAGQSNRKDKQQAMVEYESWTRSGWAKIKRVIRHKCKKKMYRVNSRFGCVDVTEDHSLLDAEGNKIKPNELGDRELLHSLPPIKNMYASNPIILKDFSNDGQVPVYDENHQKCLIYSLDYMLEKGYEIEDNDLIVCNSKLEALEVYLKLKQLYPDTEYYVTDDLNIRKGIRNFNSVVELERDTEEFVYDLETEDGTFHAGVGSLIVKNTDSIFVVWHGATLEETFDLAREAAEYLTNKLPEHIVMEDENVYHPCLLITKKKYEYFVVDRHGNVLKEDSKGSMKARRDNCDCARYIYTKAKDSIMALKPFEETIYEINEGILDMFRYRYPLKDFVIYKGLSKDIDDYAAKSGHVRFAERLKERGNDVKANTRLEYVMVKTDDKNAKSGDRMEDWSTFLMTRFIEGQQLDFVYYIEHNLINPITKILNIAYPNQEKDYFKPKERFELAMQCLLKPKWATLLKGLPLRQKAEYIIKYSKNRKLRNAALVFYSKWILDTLHRKHKQPLRYRKRPGNGKSVVYQNDRVISDISKYHMWWSDVVREIKIWKNYVKLKHIKS